MRFLNWLYDKWTEFTLFTWLRWNPRRAARLLRKGTPSRGVITGIRVSYTGGQNSSTTRYEWAVEVMPSAGERFKAGIRQNIQHADRMRLGMEVPVRHDDGHSRAIIDVPELLRRWGVEGADVHEMTWKRLRKPPRDGIEDKTLGKLKGERRTATLVDANRVHLAIGLTDNWDLVLEADGRQWVKKRDPVPIYARHLLEPGIALPVAINGEKVEVDWPAAVEAKPGSTSPPAAAAAVREEPAEAMTATPAVPVEQAVAAAPVEDSAGGIGFDTWVAVEAGLVRDRVAPADYDEYAQRHGVPPGQWAGAQAAWQSRMVSDWTIGARFGEAYEAALKKKR